MYEALKTIQDEIKRGIRLHDVGKIAKALAKAEEA
jgi:hypothetical protein